MEVREDCIILHLSRSAEREKVDSNLDRSCSCFTSVRRAESALSLVNFASVPLDVGGSVSDDGAVLSTIGGGWSGDLDKMSGEFGAVEGSPCLNNIVTVDCVDIVENEDVHVHFDPDVVIIGTE